MGVDGGMEGVVAGGATEVNDSEVVEDVTELDADERSGERESEGDDEGEEIGKGDANVDGDGTTVGVDEANEVGELGGNGEDMELEDWLVESLGGAEITEEAETDEDTDEENVESEEIAGSELGIVGKAGIVEGGERLEDSDKLLDNGIESEELDAGAGVDEGEGKDEDEGADETRGGEEMEEASDEDRVRGGLVELMVPEKETERDVEESSGEVEGCIMDEEVGCRLEELEGVVLDAELGGEESDGIGSTSGTVYLYAHHQYFGAPHTYIRSYIREGIDLTPCTILPCVI